MGLMLLTERHKEQVTGVISCFDRIIFQGTLPQLSYARGITEYFCKQGLLLKDFTHWAEPLTQRIRDNAGRVASEAGLEIQYLAKASSDKEKLVQEILSKRGNHPGLVCVFSVTERCSTYKPQWGTSRPSLCSIEARCLHYYFYFIDEEFGLCFVRVPAWAPFRLEMYMNGHNWLARQMTRQQIDYTQVDNAFVWIRDAARAPGTCHSKYARRAPAPEAGRSGANLLSGAGAVGYELSLDNSPGRIRYRCACARAV